MESTINRAELCQCLDLRHVFFLGHILYIIVLSPRRECKIHPFTIAPFNQGCLILIIDS